MKTNADAIEDVLDDVLQQDAFEKQYEKEVSQHASRAHKCRGLALNFFKTRGITAVSSDVKALSLLLYKITTPRGPGRPRKHEARS